MGEFLVQDSLRRVYRDHPLQVMLVDEQDTFRQKLRNILHGIGGFQVIAEAPSHQIALETAAHTRMDLVIADFALKDGGGVELTARLKQLPTPPRVVVFSTTMHNADLLQIILAGADGYLMKDTALRDLIRAFRNFERGGLAMQPGVAANVIALLVERCNAIESKQTDSREKELARVDTIRALQGVGDEVPLLGELSSAPRLSPQEERVFALLRSGQSNKQIAARLAISPYTVGKHVQSILRKLGAVNRTQAAAYTLFEGVQNVLPRPKPENHTHA